MYFSDIGFRGQTEGGAGGSQPDGDIAVAGKQEDRGCKAGLFKQSCRYTARCLVPGVEDVGLMFCMS